MTSPGRSCGPIEDNTLPLVQREFFLFALFTALKRTYLSENKRSVEGTWTRALFSMELFLELRLSSLYQVNLMEN